MRYKRKHLASLVSLLAVTGSQAWAEDSMEFKVSNDDSDGSSSITGVNATPLTPNKGAGAHSPDSTDLQAIYLSPEAAPAPTPSNSPPPDASYSAPAPSPSDYVMGAYDVATGQHYLVTANPVTGGYDQYTPISDTTIQAWGTQYGPQDWRVIY